MTEPVPPMDAAAWAARLDRTPDDPGVSAALDAWLAADPRHAGALLRAQAMLALVCDSAPPAGVRAAPPARIDRRHLLLGAIAASGAGLLAVPPLARHLRDERIATDIGEIRQLPMADGSTTVLNTATRIDLRLDPERRRVALRRGEALFRVARDPARPFVVEAGDVRVTAIGTAFRVRREAAGVDVLVLEGVVEVVDAGRPRVRLLAGEGGLFGGETPARVERLGSAEVARAVAWRDGRLEFDGEPLADAIAQMNRHNRRQLRLADTTHAREPLHGAFRTDDPSGFAYAIGRSLDLPVAEGPREIVLGTPPAP